MKKFANKITAKYYPFLRIACICFKKLFIFNYKKVL